MTSPQTDQSFSDHAGNTVTVAARDGGVHVTTRRAGQAEIGWWLLPPADPDCPAVPVTVRGTGRLGGQFHLHFNARRALDGLDAGALRQLVRDGGRGPVARDVALTFAVDGQVPAMTALVTTLAQVHSGPAGWPEEDDADFTAHVDVRALQAWLEHGPHPALDEDLAALLGVQAGRAATAQLRVHAPDPQEDAGPRAAAVPDRFHDLT